MGFLQVFFNNISFSGFLTHLVLGGFPGGVAQGSCNLNLNASCRWRHLLGEAEFLFDGTVSFVSKLQATNCCERNSDGMRRGQAQKLTARPHKLRLTTYYSWSNGWSHPFCEGLRRQQRHEWM